MNQSKVILNSWKANAESWIATIDNKEIESRQLVTNAAILAAVLNEKPSKLLDLGCGEGWLCRSLTKEGIEVWGVDAVERLVGAAVAKGGGHFAQLTYQQIVHGQHHLPTPFDMIVLNFALLDQEDSEALIHSVPGLLSANGRLIIQTLHPLTFACEGGYQTGWKEGSWAGMKQNFVQPYQWYFRTLSDWLKLFTAAGLHLHDMSEPLHPQTQKPLSVIFVLKPQ